MLLDLLHSVELGFSTNILRGVETIETFKLTFLGENKIVENNYYFYQISDLFQVENILSCTFL